MDSKRWNKILDITDKILSEKDPDKREALLRDQCRKEPGLEEDLRDYMRSIESSEGFLNDMKKSKNLITGSLFMGTPNQKQTPPGNKGKVPGQD